MDLMIHQALDPGMLTKDCAASYLYIRSASLQICSRISPREHSLLSLIARLFSQMAPQSSFGDGGVPLHKASPVFNGGSKTCTGPSPIAIIGMACRTPGQVSNPEDLWQMCAQGRSGWSEFPGSRFNQEAFYHPNPGKAGCV